MDNSRFMLVNTIAVGGFFSNSALHFYSVPFCAEMQKMELDTLNMCMLPQQE